MSLSRARLLGALATGCALAAGFLITPAAAASVIPGYGCVVDTPAAGAPAQYQPLELCASFDKAAYASSDVVKLTISVTNLGTATAPGVTMMYPDQAEFRTWNASTDSPLWAFGPNASGVALPAGATIVVETDGYAPDPASGAVTYTGTVNQGGGNGASYGDPVAITSAVTAVTGDYAGVVYTDNNANGQADPGEGLAGTQVTLSGPFNGLATGPSDYTATTDASGNFSFAGLPGGQYNVQFTGPDGWLINPPDNGLVTVTGSSAGPVVYQAIRPLNETLQVGMSFDQSSYADDSPAALTINFTNTGSNAITGINVHCDLSGEGNQLYGIGNDWTALNDPGVTVAAGASTTVHASELIPPGTTGTYTAECVFGPAASIGGPGDPDVSATTTVTPPTVPTTNFSVQLVDDEPFGNTANTSISLLDASTKDLIASAGNGELDGMPVGSYDLSPDSDWKLAPGQPNTLDTSELTPGQVVAVHLVPSAPQPAPPTPPLP